MSDIKEEKNLELRVLIIGEAGVGKKTITKRFKLLNCTETKETSFSKLLSKPNKNKLEKKKNLTFDIELDELLLEEERQKQKKEEIRLNLMNFTKIYKIDLNIIEISFYPIADAEPLPLDYIPKDDDEDYIFETEHKISLRKLNNEIEKILVKPLSHNNYQLELIFFFCFDLSDKNSLEQLGLYYSQINKNYNLKNHSHSILIGNKLDKKNVDSEFQERINNFQTENSMKYYEISTFMFFNFESFFEKLFFQIFGNCPSFSHKSFKDNFHNILAQKSTFSQSKRKIYPDNLNPSPNEYNNNPFEYPTKYGDLFKLFKERQKYNKKIFINKGGPIFPFSSKKHTIRNSTYGIGLSFDDKNEIEKETFPKDKDNINMFNEEFNITKVDIKQNKSPIIWDSQKQNEIKEILKPISKKKGFSIGVSLNNSLGLRKIRREENIKKSLEISNAINNGISLNRKNIPIAKGSLSQKKYEISRKKYYKRKYDKGKQIENEINEKHKNNIEINNKILKEKLNSFMEKHNKYLDKYIKREKEKLEHKKKVQTLSISNSNSHKQDLTPKARLYSPISSFSTNKGFSFGQKLPDNKLLDSPEFPYFVDDFEKILIKNIKRPHKIKGAERFPRTKSEVYVDKKANDIIIKKLKSFESKRKNFIKNKLADFFKDRRVKKKLVVKNKKELKKEEEKELTEQIIKQYSTTDEYFKREIKYNLVEDSSPKYTLKGRYENHPSLSSQAYYGSSDNIFNTYEIENYNEFFMENNHIKPKLPNYSTVKPQYPSYSFGKSKRFNYNINALNISNNNYKQFKSLENSLENDIYLDGNYGYQDSQSFLKLQTMMGTEKKFRNYKDNGVPGPGNYIIRDFAEDISRKGEIINQIRQKIREKEKFKLSNHENNQIISLKKNINKNNIEQINIDSN